MQSSFRGWWIVAVAFYSQAVTIGLTIIPFGLFATPVMEEFDASMSEFQIGLALFALMMTLSGSVIGGMLDRHSIRMIMAGGSILLALSFVGMSFAREFWQLGLLFGITASIAVTMGGPLSGTTAIAKWFDRKRGQAVGIATMGPPAGGLTLVPIAGWLLAEFGWRTTLLIFAGIAASIAPLVLAVVRNAPEDVGQEIDGISAAEAAEEIAARLDSASSEPTWTTAEILRSRSFWGLALGVGIVFGIGGGWNANAPPFGQDLGHSAQHMSLLIGLAAGLGVPATFLFGALADRLNNRMLLWVAMGGQTLSFLVLSTQPDPFLFTTAILFFGFSGGGLLPVYASLVGRLFGAPAFGTVMGLAGLVMLPFGSSSPIVAGALRDSSGSYVSTLLLFIGGFVLAMALLGLIRMPRTVDPA